MNEQKNTLARIHFIVGMFGIALFFAPFIAGLIDLIPKVEIYSRIGKPQVFIWNIACLAVFATLVILTFLRVNPRPRKIFGIVLFAWFTFWNLWMIYDYLHQQP